MPDTKIFRKVALDRLASPQQLDQLMQVTTAKGWVALIALGILLLTAVTWGWIGNLPDAVTGEGILANSGGIFQVAPGGGGRVLEISVKVGDMLSEGQVVARIAQPDLADAVRDAKDALARARQEREQITRFGARDASMQAAALVQQQRSVEESIRGAERNLTWLDEKVRNQTQLADRGLITKQTLLTSKQQLGDLQQKLLASQGQLSQLHADELQVQSRQNKDMQLAQYRVEQTEEDLVQKERAFREASEVTSQYSGRVLEVMAEQGTVIARGEPMLTLDQTGRTVRELQAIIYVPSMQGKRLKTDMRIHIAPSTVRKEEFGYMIGRVTYVSDFPATPKGMLRVLKNEKLASKLSAGDAPYEVRANLTPDPATTSHYRWSSSSGPPLTIQGGTLATAEIIVNQRRPIELVVPMFRKYTGL